MVQLDKPAAPELAKQSADQHEGHWSLHSAAGAVPVTQWHLSTGGKSQYKTAETAPSSACDEHNVASSGRMESNYMLVRLLSFLLCIEHSFFPQVEVRKDWSPNLSLVRALCFWPCRKCLYFLSYRYWMFPIISSRVWWDCLAYSTLRTFG